MQRGKRLYIAGYFFLLIVLLFRILLLRYNLDNYFMFAHARKIMDTGTLWTQEPLTIHEGWNFLYPQWLYAITIYLIKTYVGNKGVYLFSIALLLLTVYLIQMDVRLLMDENKWFRIVSLLLSLPIILFYTSIRPYIVTLNLCLGVWYVLEKLDQAKEKKWFWLLLMLSVLGINFHNSLWIAQVLLCLCFVAEKLYFVVRYGRERTAFFLFCIAIFIVLVGGFLNPYGGRGITYIFTSMRSLMPYKDMILELKTPSLTKVHGLLFYEMVAIDIVVFVIAYFYKIKIPIRYYLLTFGFMILSIFAVRNLLFFFSFGQFFLPVIFRQLPDSICGETEGICGKIALFLIMNFFLMAIICVKMEEYPTHELTEAVCAIEAEQPSDGSRFFTEFDTGSCIDYLGYPVYIDARAEIYGAANNGVRDVASEFVELYNSDSVERFKELDEEYQFDYAFVYSDGRLDQVVKATGDYVLLYENEIYAFLKKLK